MAIVISGVNNNDKITASDGTIDLLSGVTFTSEITAHSFKVGNNIQLGNAGIITATSFSGNNVVANHFINVGSNIQLGNAGVATATTFVGNLTGNVNNTGNLLLQVGGGEKFRVGGSGQLGIGGANYGTSGQVLTSGGSGGAVTWSTVNGTTINNNADNRIITGSGTANTLNGESGLTFSSDRLILTNSSTPQIRINNDTNDGASTRFVFGKATANNNFFNGAVAGDSCIGFPGDLLFGVGTSIKARIKSDGKVVIGSNAAGADLSVSGNLILDNGTTARLTLQAENNNTNQILSTTTGFGSYTALKYMAADHKFQYGGNELVRIHATSKALQVYGGDLLLGPDNVSQMEATIRAWGCSLWFTTIDTDYYHDSGGEFRVFYNKGSFRGDNYLTAYNCPIQSGVGPQNRVFWRGSANDTRAEGTVDISVGYRGAFFFISRASCSAIKQPASGKYLYDSNSPNRVSVSFDSFGNNIDTQELSFHCGNTAGYNSGDATIGGRLGNSNSDSTLRMYAVGVNMENYNAPNSKKAGNHIGVSVINEDGTDYTATTASRLSENLINNGTTGSTNGGGSSTEFNWGTRHSNDRGYDSNFQFSQIMYFDDVQLNSAQWDYLEHYFKVMYG